MEDLQAVLEPSGVKEFRVTYDDCPDGLGTLFAELTTLTGESDWRQLFRKAMVSYSEDVRLRARGGHVVRLDREYNLICEVVDG